jgi:hypothetical protein
LQSLSAQGEWLLAANALRGKAEVRNRAAQ